MHRILIADSLDATGVALLAASGAHVHELRADERPRLAEILADYDALIVRSATKVTAELLAAGKQLKVVGRAGIGVDNVDVKAATERGILVVNAPTANMMSATEHTFALLLSLARRVCAADASLKAGHWDRTSFVGTELQGKALGIVGFGRIGQRVAARAQAFEMRVLAFDPFLDADLARRQQVEMVDLDELLGGADVVTLHTPLTEATRNLLNADRLRAMKRGALLVNCGRGGVVDEAAMLELLDSGHLAGAALDVFAHEPLESYELVRHPKVVATPHIGAQTEEAQLRIANDTAEMVLKALDGSMAVTAVNLPFRSASFAGDLKLALGEKLGRLASALLDGKLRRVEVEFQGIDPALHHPISVAVLKGALSIAITEGVNFVNAETLAAARGVELVRAERTGPCEYSQLLRVLLHGPEGSVELAGTIFGERDARVVNFRGYQLEFRPQGQLMLLENSDVPGVVGKLGSFLGDRGINIAHIHLARHQPGLVAVAALELDQLPSAEQLAQLIELPEVLAAKIVDLGDGF